jgi:hypothetical protein
MICSLLFQDSQFNDRHRRWCCHHTWTSSLPARFRLDAGVSEFLPVREQIARGVFVALHDIATVAAKHIAKRRGKAVGRPRKLTAHQLDHARALLTTGKETRAGVAELFGVDVATLRRALNVA